MKFTNKFTFITSAVVLTCISLVLIGGLVSLRAFSLKYQQQRIDSIINVIERQIDKQIPPEVFSTWLPDILDASGVVRLLVKQKGVSLYKSYEEGRQYFPTHRLLRYDYTLEKYPEIELVLYTRQPFSDIRLTFWPLLGITTAIFLSLGLLYFAIRWIKCLFLGAELLDKRAGYLLQNNPTARFAQAGEWPRLASKALDVLSERLENSRKERSIFDVHIRGKAFLDEGTGLGNLLAFENRLDVVAMDENFTSNSLILISLTELSRLKYQYGIEEKKKVVQDVANILKHFCRRYEDSFYGRAHKNEFVIILPQMSYEETKVSAKQLTKLLFQLQLPEENMIETFFHIGVVNFPFSAKPRDIIDDVNRSLLVAEHQKNSGWHLSDEDITHAVILKGTVRWRALLTDVLEKQALLLYKQSVIMRDAKTIIYSELWPRIRGYQQEVIAAGTFMPMAEKCGLSEHVDRQMLEKTLALLVIHGEVSKPIAINLGALLLMSKVNHKWFMFELMQQSRKIRSNLVIEVSEHLVEKHYFPLRTALISLQKVGCKLAIDNVGKSVVNTEYILDFNIDYLKLHASLVRDIEVRKTNQIAVQSLIASCLNSDAKVIAVGVETDLEWQCLLDLGIYAGQGTLFSSPQWMDI